MADIFNKPVYAALAPNSGCLGGAFRALDATSSTKTKSSTTSTVECLVAAQPRHEYTQVYDEMLIRYAKLEDQIKSNFSKHSSV